MSWRIRRQLPSQDGLPNIYQFWCAEHHLWVSITNSTEQPTIYKDKAQVSEVVHSINTNKESYEPEALMIEFDDEPDVDIGAQMVTELGRIASALEAIAFDMEASS